MDFSLSDDQRALAAAVRDLITDRFGTEFVRSVVEDPDGDGNPERLWKAVSDQGWLAVLVPEAHGGLGLGMLDAQVVARAFGAATTPGPWLVSVLAGEALRLAGSDAQQAAWLPRLAGGEVVLSVAVAGNQGGPAAVTERGGALTGTLPAVEYAHLADRVVVQVGPDTLHLVDPAGPGVQVRRYDSLDRTTRLAELRLTDAPGELLAGPDAGAAAVVELHRRGAVLTASDLVGVARAAVTRTVSYDRDRVQFGRPVGSFQAIKHHLADLHVAVTMAEHGALFAAHALDVRPPDLASAVSVAKAKASDAAREATAAMIQYHGGIGYTWEHDAHFYFKRAKREEYLFGDGAWHRERLASLLLDGPPDPVASA
jgi:alkylation response protein AidB-like acyl-CoA dehydrogenase